MKEVIIGALIAAVIMLGLFVLDHLASRRLLKDLRRQNALNAPRGVRDSIARKLKVTMQNQTMQIKRNESTALPATLDLAEALVERAGDPQHLVDLAHIVWPGLRVQRSGNHWLFMTQGTAMKECFVVEVLPIREPMLSL